MLENFTTFFKKKGNKELPEKSKNAAKERLHLVLMQDRANVSADFLDMMKHEIVDVVKKYIDVDETDMDVKLENRVNNDGTSGAPALYANIPIVGINEEKKKESEEIKKAKENEEKIQTENVETEKVENKENAKNTEVTEDNKGIKVPIVKGKHDKSDTEIEQKTTGTNNIKSDNIKANLPKRDRKSKNIMNKKMSEVNDEKKIWKLERNHHTANVGKAGVNGKENIHIDQKAEQRYDEVNGRNARRNNHKDIRNAKHIPEIMQHKSNNNTEIEVIKKKA